MTLHDLLARNQGNVLTPELITGLTQHALYLERLTTEVPEAVTDSWVAPDSLRPSNTRLVLDQHQRIADFVANLSGCSAEAWAGYVTLGLETQAGELVAGIVLENYNGRNANVHVAGVGKHWLNRNLLVTFFSYCFDHLQLTRLTGLVAASNQAALTFDLHLGFRHEFTMRDGAKDGDLHILVMRRDDCRFLPQEVSDDGR